MKLIWGDYPIELNLLFCKKLPNHEYSQNLLSAVTHLGLISAENLRQAHALIESGKSIGKVVLSGSFMLS